MLLDLERVIVECNTAAAKMLGEDLQSVLQRSILDFIASQDIEVFSRHWGEAVAAGRPVSCHLTLCQPDGGTRFAELRTLPLLDANGTIDAFTMSLTDASDSQLRQEEIERLRTDLRASEARLAGFYDSKSVLASIVELRGDDFVYVRPNDEIAAFFGMTAGELTGCSARALGFPEEKRIECVAHFRQCAAGRDSLTTRYTFDFGETRYRFFGTIKYLCEAAGGPQFSLTLIDESNQMTAELASRAIEERYRTFVDHAADAFMLHGPDGAIVDVNRHACESLGYERDELIGMMPGKFAPLMSTDEGHDLNRRLDAGETVSFDSVHRRKDGSEFPVEVRIRPCWIDGTRHVLSFSRDISERKRVEDALRASELRYRTLVDHATDGVFLHDAECCIIDVNRNACTSLGYTHEELIGQTPLMFDPDVTPEMLADFNKRMTAGESISFDTRHRRKDGTTFPVEIRARPLHVNGEFHILATARDITERKRAEEALLQSESRLRGAIENIPDVIVLYDLDLRVHYINAATRPLTGMPPEAFIGRRDDEVFPPSVWSTYLPTLKAARETKSIQSIETDICFADGSERSVKVTCVPLLNHDGSLRELLGIAQDFTERKRAERATREGEQRFSQFMEHLPGLAWIKDARGCYVYANTAAARSLGTTMSNLLGKEDAALIPKEIAAEYRHSDEHVLSSGHGIQLYEHRVDGAGQDRHSLISKFPIPVSNGGPPMVGGVAIDVTDRIQAEATIRRIVEGIAPTTGQDFFRTLATHLSEACDVDYAFIARIDPGQPDAMQTIAVSRDGEIIENFGYCLRGTPCEHVVSRGICYFASGVREAFLNDALLAKLGIESYMGAPLFSSEGSLLGLVSLMSRRSIGQHERAMAILRVVAARAGAELEREQAQAELGRTRLEFDFLAEAFPSTVFRANERGEVVSVNDLRWMHLTGREPGSWRDDRWLAAVHPEDRDRIAGSWRDFVNGRDAWADEFRFLRSDGHVSWVLAQAVPMRDEEGGRIRDFFGAYIDITHLIETKQALRLTQYSVDQASIAIFWTDRALKIRYVNDWACQSVGYSRDDLLGMSMLDLTTHTSEEWAARFEQVKERGSLWFETQHRRKDGSCFPVEVSVNYVRFSGEDFMFAFAQDMTERKQVEDRLEQQSAELAHVSRLSTMGQMVATLSHELAQPLSAVSNYANACAMQVERLRSADPLLAEYLEGISKQANRAGDILRRVRDFVRKSGPQTTSCDLNELLIDSLALLVNDFRRHDIRVTTELERGAVPIKVDRIQIQQIVVNLLTNARDALQSLRKSQRVVTVRSRVESSRAVFEVEDGGVGFSENLRGRLFEPFVTTKATGMGIGLSICKSIAESHGGTIRAERGVLGGALFRVELPLAEAARGGK